ncbi:MAG: AAA family ATPase, partial [Methanogenium sp.]|nr:AAA family ATPase [Methanogenium sp.]
MYLSNLKISNFRCYDEIGININIKSGLTVFVGENDSGKTAIIDAIRFVLGTSDQEWNKVKDTDFCNEDSTKEIKIVCKFEKLTKIERGSFLEYLTYETDAEGKPNKEVLYVNWTAKKINTGINVKREFIKTEIRSGKNADGPSFNQEVRELLRTTYLKPLRDAKNAMSAGRNSRFSQILRNIALVNTGNDEYRSGSDLKELSVVGIANLADSLLGEHPGISSAKSNIDNSLSKKFLLKQDQIQSKINVYGTANNKDKQLKIMLEKLTLNVERKNDNAGHLGLGTNNLLYMACELLLLQQEDEGNRMLIIEEPEAHIHVQRQLKILKSLQKETEDNNVQVIITTHSPLLASVIKLENMVLIQNGTAFSLGKEHTKLNPSDYRFLERFLDATKANLFFAKGVVIVEGAAENILLPAIARIIGYDFVDYGISIVNVGGIGLSRYSKIFQRSEESEGIIKIPVACITDLDIMPDCAPEICLDKKYEDISKWPKGRRWKVYSDFVNNGIENKGIES